MATFKSDKEKSKWDTLEHRAGESIAKLTQGRAGSGDINNLKQILKQMSSLAHDVFTEAIKAAEEEALRIQLAGQIDLKEGLSKFESALNQAITLLEPNLVQKLHEVVSLDFYEQTDEITKGIGSNFEDLKTLLPPKDLPTTDDLLAANDLLAERLEAFDGEGWEKKEASLVEKLTNMFGATLRTFTEGIMGPHKPEGGAKKGYVKGQRHSMNRYELEDQPTKPNIANQAMSMVGRFGAAANDEQEQDPTEEQGEGITAPAASPVAAQAQQIIAMPKETAQILEQGSQAQQDFFARLEQILGQGADASDNVVDEEKESKKADSWWRSFKGFFGDKLDDKGKSKKSGGGASDWLKMLGVGLLSMILTPQLWQSLADMIQKYVTWDNIKAAVMGSWDYIKEKGTEVLAWVWSKLTSINVKEIGEWTANLANTVWTKIKEFFGFGGDSKGASPAKKALGAAASWVGGKLGIGGGDKGGSSSGSSSPSSSTGPAVTANPSTTTNAKTSGGALTTSSSGNTVNKTAPAQNSLNVKGGTTNTTSVSNASVKYAQGATTPVPGTSSPTTNTGGGSQAPTQGNQAVGIHSFGMTSSIDDSLILMNSSFLGLS